MPHNSSTSLNANTPFLRQVAQYYITKDDPQFHRYCFVFPNRRGGTFFIKEITECAQPGKPIITPHVTNITDFVSDITGQIQASQVEALFILYLAYLQLSERNDDEYPFENFIFWGNTVLNDFNETDKYLIDPNQLFSNVANLREIGTNYIPDDVKEILERYLNININAAYDEDSFWRHIRGNGDNDRLAEKYNALWNSMLALYNAFRQSLSQYNLSYEGKAYRDAVDIIKNLSPDQLPFKRYVFVGFNIISKCEQQFFKLLAQMNVADFFWDDAAPAFADENNCGSHHIRANRALFPMPQDFVLQQITSVPGIHSVAVPSKIGQAQFVASILSGPNSEIPYCDDNPDTAVVLPEENLLLPVINALPPDIKKINVTMGYPLRNSDIMSLLRSVTRMHIAARRRGTTWAFYRDFVKDVLSHPLIKAHYNDVATSINDRIDAEFIFDVPTQMFVGTPLQCLFTVIDSQEPLHHTLQFISDIADFAADIKQLITEDNHIDDDNSNPTDANHTSSLQGAFIDQFIAIMAQLHSVVQRFQVRLTELTVLNIADRLSSILSIPFEGEPLQGLQIMGTLETRALDFSNIIILSVNERVFPQKSSFKPSFIPHLLRRAYGLPTVEAQEEASTYYFYRMISRASNVWLIHNSAIQDFGSSEPSRFIKQLQKIYGTDVVYHEVTLEQAPTEAYEVTVHEPLKAEPYFNTDNQISQATHSHDPRLKGVSMLSASSINHFISCPLQFYLQHICGFNNDSPESDFMDAATFGTIVHDSLQSLYLPDGCDTPHNVSLDQIKHFASSSNLHSAIKRNINRTFLHRPDNRLDEDLTGQAIIIFNALKTYALKALDHDIALLKNSGAEHPFLQVLECETPHFLNLAIGSSCFNFQFRADRIDRVNGTGPVRIIDYKTGSDDVAFSDISELFNSKNKKKHKKAILQLFLYCNAYMQIHPDVDEVQPLIYSLRNSKFEVSFGHDKKKEQITITRDCDLNAQFISQFTTVITRLRAGDFPQTDNPLNSPCSYCNFADICHK